MSHQGSVSTSRESGNSYHRENEAKKMNMLESEHSEAPAPSGTLGTAKHRRWRSIMVVLLVSLINLALLAVIAFQLVTPAQNHAQSSPLIGHPAPDFTLATLSRQPAPAIHLAQW